MDTDPRTTPEALAEFNRFYSTVHVYEVIAAHPGFISANRYELVGPGTGPRWLAVYGMADQAAAEQYVKDNARPWLHRRTYSPWPSARRRAKTVWRMIWRRLGDSGAVAGAVPGSIALVGTNVGTEEPLVAEAGVGAVRRLELYREFAHPVPGSPRYCTVYEAAHELSGARGQDPDTAWSLAYRLIVPQAAEGAG
jgi:hypothetical protein